MYVWIWRRLPGGLPGKLIGSALLLGAAVALLFFVVFPWIEPKLPFNEVTVNQPGSTATPSVTPTR
jgi:hypothetical protein